MTFPMELAWEIVAIIGVILGIISSAIGVMSFLKARKIESKIGPAKEWRIELLISDPSDESDIKGHVCGIAGQVSFFVSSLQFEGSPKVNLFLVENEVDIFLLVQPLTNSNFWWVQPKPLIQQNGDFNGSVFIGDKQGHGIGAVFQVALVAVPSGSIKAGEKLREAPFTYAVSDIVKVKRIS